MAFPDSPPVVSLSISPYYPLLPPSPVARVTRRRLGTSQWLSRDTLAYQTFLISTSKHLFMPMDSGILPLTSSHKSLSTLTVLISFLRSSDTTSFILPWSVQLYFFLRRAKNCSTVSAPPLAPE